MPAIEAHRGRRARRHRLLTPTQLGFVAAACVVFGVLFGMWSRSGAGETGAAGTGTAAEVIIQIYTRCKARREGEREP